LIEDKIYFFVSIELVDRCYKAFETEKTWNDARLFCRERYADLVTWHDNSDEQIIRLPFKKLLETEKVSTGVLNDFSADKLPKFRAYWSAATIDSFNRLLKKRCSSRKFVILFLSS